MPEPDYHDIHYEQFLWTQGTPGEEKLEQEIQLDEDEQAEYDLAKAILERAGERATKKREFKEPGKKKGPVTAADKGKINLNRKIVNTGIDPKTKRPVVMYDNGDVEYAQ